MRPLVRFLYAYVVRLGFLDGMPGLVFCTLLAFYDFLAWANVYERRSGSTEEASGRDGRAPSPIVAGRLTPALQRMAVRRSRIDSIRIAPLVRRRHRRPARGS